MIFFSITTEGFRYMGTFPGHMKTAMKLAREAESDGRRGFVEYSGCVMTFGGMTLKEAERYLAHYLPTLRLG